MASQLKPKRKPLLIDEFLASNVRKYGMFDDPKKVEVVQERMRDAKVFALDQQAAIYAAEMIRDYPHAIAHDQEFAIPPFARTYIELPYPQFYRTLGGRLRPDLPEDTDVGYYIDNNRAYVLSRSEDKDKHHFMLPIRYRLNQPFTTPEELRFADLIQTSRMGLDALFWGSVLDRIDESDKRALRANHSCEGWPDDLGLIRMNTMHGFLMACAGDLRNILALVLFLNRTRDVHYTDELPPAPAFVHAKPRTLVRHSVVRLRLDPGPLFKRAYEGRGQGSIWRREHEVRGHFCHDKTWRDHPHDHDPREYDVNQWRCLLCGGLKWWRKDHRRGKKDAGQVKTEYRVSA